MVAFSRLPDACLLALFKQLPPEDQLRFRSVCRKWDSLIPVAASTRRSLIIFLGCRIPQDVTDICPIEEITSEPAMRLLVNEDGSPMFPREPVTIWNSLHIPRLNNNWRLIGTTFTGVKHLQGIITSKNLKHLVLFAILLERWRYNLTSVHLLEYLFVPSAMSIQPAVRRLYAAINSLPHLKRLVLYHYKLPLQDLPVIVHLEELDIITLSFFGIPNQYSSCEHHNHQLVKMLQKYGRLEQGLPQVSYAYMGECTTQRSILKRLITLGPAMCQAFTRLDISNICTFKLSTVCNHFQGLTSIKVLYYIDDTGLMPLFEELSKLKKLVYLWLEMPIYCLRYKDDHLPLPQLPTVKALVVKAHLPTPQHMATLDISWLFPNLQVIQFELFERNNFFLCGGHNDVPYANPEFVKECLRQIFHPLKRRFGDKLTILHSLTDFFHNICSTEELLAKM